MKLTSPNLNYFIILGALSLYIGSLIRVTPSTSLVVWDHVCRVSGDENWLMHDARYWLVLKQRKKTTRKKFKSYKILSVSKIFCSSLALSRVGVSVEVRSSWLLAYPMRVTVWEYNFEHFQALWCHVPSDMLRQGMHYTNGEVVKGCITEKCIGITDI